MIIQELRKLKRKVRAVDIQLTKFEGKFSQFESTLEQVKLGASIAGQRVVDLKNRFGKIDSVNKVLDDEMGG